MILDVTQFTLLLKEKVVLVGMGCEISLSHKSLERNIIIVNNGFKY